MAPSGEVPEHPCEPTSVLLQTALGSPYNVHKPGFMGGFGCVFRVSDQRLQQDVAVKVLRAGNASMLDEAAFIDEMRIVGQFSNEHIVKSFMTVHSEGLLYSMMEWMPDGSLADMISRGRLSVQRTLEIAIDIADALEHAYARRVIHLDIKPGNILFKGRTAKLADFGLARITDRIGGSHLTKGGIKGTWPYMSPEQWQNDSKVLDHRSDLYSLGCAIYEMLTGAPPYGSSGEWFVLMTGHVLKDLPTLHDGGVLVHKDIELLVRTLLDKSPDLRFADATALKLRLRELQDLAHLDATQPIRRSSSRAHNRRAPAVIVKPPTGPLPTRSSTRIVGGAPITFGRLLHLSDLHLDATWAPTPARLSRQPRLSESPSTVGQDVDALLAFLSARASEIRTADASASVIDAVVITGNLVRAEDTVKSSAAALFLHRLRTVLDIPASRILLLSGSDDLVTRKGTRMARSVKPLKELAVEGYLIAESPADFFLLEEQALGLLAFDTEGVHVSPAIIDKIVRHTGNHPDREIRKEEPWVRAALSHLVKALPDHRSNLGTTPAKGVPLTSPQPRQVLHIGVSHFPLVATLARHRSKEGGTAQLPTASAQTRRALRRSGISIALHGHARHHEVQRTRSWRGDERDEFVSVGAAALTSGERGFNLLQYAVRTDTGEARVRVQAMLLDSDGRVAEGPSVRIGVIGRGLGRARVTRVTEKINLQGDSRTDVWVSEMSTEGWQHEEGSDRKTHVMRINHEADMGAIGALVPSVFNPPHVVRKAFLPDGGAPYDGMPQAQLKGQLRFSAPEHVKDISFAYRFFSRQTYAMSLPAKIRCRGTSQSFPALPFDHETLVHVVRDPTDILELFVRFPAGAPAMDEVDLVTYTEDRTEQLVESAELRELSERSLDSWPEAGHIRATIKKPLPGAGYALQWKLPNRDPGIEKDFDQEQIDGAILQLEHVRKWLLEARSNAIVWKFVVDEVIAPFINTLTNVIRGADPACRLDDLEIMISIPTLEQLTIESYREQYGSPTGDAPELTIIGGNVAPNDERYGLVLPVPNSVSGRAFASNQGAEHVASQAARTGKQTRTGLEPYWIPRRSDQTPMRSHAVLYAVPIRHKHVDTVVLGAISIGAYELDTTLNLLTYDKTQNTPTTVMEVAIYAGMQLTEDLGILVAGFATRPLET